VKPSKDRLLELSHLSSRGVMMSPTYGTAVPRSITAGDLLNPSTQQFVQMDVPSGSAARIALAHINNHIIRSKPWRRASSPWARACATSWTTRASR
jgi:hypothetical protein